MTSANRRIVFYALPALIMLAALVLAPAARADIVISNLNQSNNGDISSGTQVGVAVLVADTAINVTSIQMNQGATGPTNGEFAAIFSRNPNGTVGSNLFNDFTMSFDGVSGLETATPNSPLVLAPGTGYWITLNSSGTVNWNFTFSPNYTANLGVTLPTDHTSTLTNAGGTQYFTLSDGPQLFQVNGTAVPEPSGLLMAGIVAVGGLATSRSRRK